MPINEETGEEYWLNDPDQGELTEPDTDYLSRFQDWVNSIGGVRGLLDGTGSLQELGRLLGFGGGAILANNLLKDYTGTPGIGPYLGGIPKYTLNRQQTPLAQQRPEGYRPGQGGIAYFTPHSYSNVAPPTTPAPAPTTTPAPQPPNDQGNSTLTRAVGGTIPNQGIASLAAGGRFLRGPGDGVSDNIPARLADGGPARLADGEFVFPARIVSEIGNGSSEAGARKLYAFMDRVEKLAKTAKRGEPSGADKLLNKLA